MTGLLILMCLMFMIQYSSFYSSLILVPCSIVLMLLLNLFLVASSLYLYIFILIFVGGLLILLVSVSSVVVQEQGSIISGSTAVLLLLSVTSMSTINSGSTPASGICSWLEFNLSGAVIISLILLLSTVIISALALGHKALARSICPSGV